VCPCAAFPPSKQQLKQISLIHNVTQQLMQSLLVVKHEASQDHQQFRQVAVLLQIT
jgi:hypothetical protein